MKKVSIIVPIYNVEKYLERCVYSLLKQTLKEIEIILVDDGSTDKSGRLCDELAKIDSRISVIHKKNGGLSDARNEGIKYANTKYIAFIDSDDFVDTDMFESLYLCMEKENADIAVCKYMNVKENEKKEFLKSGRKKIYSSVEAIKSLLFFGEITNHAWNKLYRKDLFQNIKYPQGKNFEDIGTTYKLFDKSKKIVYLDSECYAYVIRNGSITTNLSKKSFLDETELIKERYMYIKGKYPELQYENTCNRTYFSYRFHMDSCKFFDKSMFDSELMNEEYQFFRKNYNLVKKDIKEKKFFMNLLFIDRKLFFYLIKLLRIIQRGIK